ncbi:MAG: hypothetical protein R3E39_30020 [Anaerolineae bacterium]
MPERTPRGCRRTLLSMLAVCLAMLLCIGGTTLGLDGLCVASVTPRMPVYPGATITSKWHTFLRQFGMGESVMILHTPDDPEKVRSWYAVTISEVLRQNGNKGTFGSAKWAVDPAPEGDGSEITLYSACAV